MDGLTSVGAVNLNANNFALLKTEKGFRTWSPTLESSKELQQEDSYVL